jgi:hypothetical protein
MPIDPVRKDPRAATFQIDPYKGAALYQLFQGAAPTGAPIEVGWVYVVGASRTDCVEHWLLYASVGDQAALTNKAPYTWPTGDAAAVSIQFQFVETTGEPDMAKRKAALEASGVAITHIKATCAPGAAG